MTVRWAGDKVPVGEKGVYNFYTRRVNTSNSMRTRTEWVLRNLGWRIPGRGTIHDDYFRDEATTIVPTRPVIADSIVDNWQLQDLVMCPVGGRVTTKLTTTGFAIQANHSALIQPGRHNESAIQRDHYGFFLWIEWVMFASSTPTGFGCCAPLRAAQSAQRLGLLRIDLLAAGGTGSKGKPWNPGFNGYYSWARFGFNCLLEPTMLQKVQRVSHLAHCAELLDIIDIDPDWWKNNGDGCVMSFDLAENSRSWQNLYNYLKSRGLQT